MLNDQSQTILNGASGNARYSPCQTTACISRERARHFRKPPPRLMNLVRAFALLMIRASTSASLTISQAQSPTRARISSTARSRHPTGVRRPQLSIARWACSAEKARGLGRTRPACHCGHAPGESRRDFSTEQGVTKERPQCRDKVLKRSWPHALCLALNEGVCVGRADVTQTDNPVTETPRHEFAGHPRVGLDGHNGYLGIP